MGRPKLGLDLCRTIAASRGGRLLSTQYVRNVAPLLWEYTKGHQWQATHVKDGGTWCPFCAGNLRLGLQVAIMVAKSRGGECLCEAYRNAKTSLLWRCQYGHTWWACLNSVKNQGSWCPTCAGKRPLTLEEARSVAAERGGELLSESYSNSQSKLHWRCANGHEWCASLGSVKHARSWCPTCAHTAQRLDVALAHQAAVAHGGKCLSETYKNNYTHLLWRCAKGHEWRAPTLSVRNKGYWCPSCASGRREREVRAVCVAY